MNREALSAAKPKWLELEHCPTTEQLVQCVRYVELVIDSMIACGHELDDWESKHLVYAIHAIVQERFFAALTFAEMAAMDPVAHRPIRVHVGDLQPLSISDLQKALALLKAKRMPSI